MKKSKHYSTKVMNLGALLIVLIFCLAGCGQTNHTDSAMDSQPETSISAQPDMEETDNAQEDETKSGTAEILPPVMTIEESEAWLLYSDGSYAEVLVHGPEGNVSGQVCLQDGTDVETDGGRLFFGARKLAPGWNLMVTNKIPDEYSMENLAVKLTWEDGGKGSDGAYPSTLITELGGPRTADELRAGGMVVWDEHYGAMLEARTTYGSGSGTDLDAPSFGLFFELYFYGADQNVLPEDLGSQLTFFAGDGTPLKDYFEGFDSIEIEVGTASVYMLLYRSDGAPYDETEYKEMCDELRACEPYMVFTGKDGTAQQFSLLQE